MTSSPFDESKEAVDFEVAIHHREGDSWTVEMRVTLPGSDVEARREYPADCLPFGELGTYVGDDAEYGGRLSEILFSIPELKERFTEANAMAESTEAPLRFRLCLGLTARHLHAVRWETIRHPVYGTPLLTSEHVQFSRYVNSVDFRPLSIKPKTHIRAVLAVASPRNLEKFRPAGRQLAAIDAGGELERAMTALTGVKIVRALPRDGRATLRNIVDAVDDGCDILYLLCHGFVDGGDPWIVLENEDGLVDRVAGQELVEKLREMRIPPPPRLIFLGSCQSAGTGTGTVDEETSAVVGLGPRLAEAGIPAVVAMQGNLSVPTLEHFMPRFFAELRKDGQIDRAMAVARGEVYKEQDWWVPALFMRSKTGRIWYGPSYADDQFKQWPAVLGAIRHRTRPCAAVLGLGVAEALFGSRNELAQEWARQFDFPMTDDDAEDFPRVAQYVAVNQTDADVPRNRLIEHLGQRVREYIGDRLPAERTGASLDELIEIAGEHMRREDDAEPHKVLASLPFSIYLTTDPSPLLFHALLAAGRKAEVDYCRWRPDIDEWPPPVSERDPLYRPTPDRPLVLHLFGTLQIPDSLVVTEDDYYDYLMNVTRIRDVIPSAVTGALPKASLLFLGHRMEDWDFKVLFRALLKSKSDESRGQRSGPGPPHVAAQIDPEAVDAKKARVYLTSYFRDFQESNLSTYWGTVQGFVAELKERWEAEPQ